MKIIEFYFLKVVMKIMGHRAYIGINTWKHLCPINLDAQVSIVAINTKKVGKPSKPTYQGKIIMNRNNA